MVFKKGQSGNPGGRKKKTAEDYDLIGNCRLKTPAALTTILDIMENGMEKNRLAAAIAIIERGHGKPEAKMDLTFKMSLAEALLAITK